MRILHIAHTLWTRSLGADECVGKKGVKMYRHGVLKVLWVLLRCCLVVTRTIQRWRKRVHVYTLCPNDCLCVLTQMLVGHEFSHIDARCTIRTLALNQFRRPLDWNKSSEIDKHLFWELTRMNFRIAAQPHQYRIARASVLNASKFNCYARV